MTRLADAAVLAEDAEDEEDVEEADVGVEVGEYWMGCEEVDAAGVAGGEVVVVVVIRVGSSTTVEAADNGFSTAGTNTCPADCDWVIMSLCTTTPPGAAVFCSGSSISSSSSICGPCLSTDTSE